MEILNLVQSSPDWYAARAKHFCASEAAAAMSVSKYQTRDELLHQKHTGLAPEVDAAKQRLFDAGHAAEAGARAIAEQIADTEFAPMVGVEVIDGMPMLASGSSPRARGTAVRRVELEGRTLHTRPSFHFLRPTSPRRRISIFDSRSDPVRGMLFSS